MEGKKKVIKDEIFTLRPGANETLEGGGMDRESLDRDTSLWVGEKE